ncbi:MAG: peptidoglycan editing factor PgeF [Janthinobacterium lividum]
MLEPLQSDLLSDHHTIKHGFFTRQGGYSTGLLSSLNMRPLPPECEENFQKNCQRVCSWFQNDVSNLVLMQQVHGDHVVWIEDNANEDYVTADAMLTQKSNLILGVRTADCIPLLLYDPKASICGVIHVGWRGALLNIISKTLQMMSQRGSLPSNIHAAIGPCIQIQNFEVDQVVCQEFLNYDPYYQSFFISGKDQHHFWFNLPALALYQLKSQGVTKVESLDINTYQDEKRFFSYRRSQHALEKMYGTQISAIALK